MDVTRAISSDLPGMPEEVASGWLAPHAAREGLGWPPQGETWARLLMGRPLAWWQAQNWHREALPMTLDVMSHAVRFQVTRLIDAMRNGRDILPDSRARIASARVFLDAEGTWPGTAVAFADADGLGLADGHHRLAALEMARSDGVAGLRARHAVWIALPGRDAGR